MLLAARVSALRSALRAPAAPWVPTRPFVSSVPRQAEKPADAARAPEAAAPSAEATEQPAVDNAGERVSLESAKPFSPLPGFGAREDDAGARPAPSMDDRNVQRPHRLHVQSTRNNTIVTLTTPAGDTLASASGGTVGFKKAGRSGYEAGYRAAFRVFDQIAENRGRWRLHALEVLWNGFGQGREAVFRAMMASEGALVRGLVKTMTDKTPIKVGGVRPKKRRSTWD